MIKISIPCKICHGHKTRFTEDKREQVSLVLNLYKTLNIEANCHRYPETSKQVFREHITEIIISVRTKDGNEYRPTSFRSLLASFERQLKKKGYSASIINNLVFEKTKKFLQSNQKQPKMQGKGNKPKALTSEELKILYEKGLLGMCSPEALF